MNEHHKFCGSDVWREMVREKIIPWALHDAVLGDDVLEVGPGYGATTEVFRERVGHLTAVEIDPELAGRLVERFAGTNVTIVEGDATAMPLEDGRFTGAVCFTMLHHVPGAEQQDRLFAEVARVLRPGAVLVATDSVYNPQTEAAHEGDTYEPVDPTTLPARLAAAGFADVEVELGESGWAARATARRVAAPTG